MITTVDEDPKSLILVIADMARSNPPMTTPFVSELVRELQGQSPSLALALNWVEQRLAEDGATTEQIVQAGKPEPGGGPGHDRQLDRQPALPRRRRLAASSSSR